jgi:hypothetical protein
MAESVLKETLTGLAIREFLSQVGEGAPNDFYREFRKVKPTTSYDSVRRYFYILKRLGLIEPTRTEKGKAPIPRQLYRIVPGMEGAPEWMAPQIAMYPETKWGRRRYGKAKGGRI